MRLEIRASLGEIVPDLPCRLHAIKPCRLVNGPDHVRIRVTRLVFGLGNTYLRYIGLRQPLVGPLVVELHLVLIADLVCERNVVLAGMLRARVIDVAGIVIATDHVRSALHVQIIDINRLLATSLFLLAAQVLYVVVTRALLELLATHDDLLDLGGQHRRAR